MNRYKLLVPACCGFCFFLGVELGGFQLVLMRLAEFFSLSPVMMGFLVTAQYAAITLAPVCTGPLGDRFGKKKLLVVFAPLFIAGCFLTVASPSIPVFLAAIFLVGASYSVCESAVSSVIADTFPEKQSRYLNMTQCFMSMGAVLSPLAYSRLFPGSWRIAFITPAIGFGLFFPLLCLSRCSKHPAAGDDRGGYRDLFRRPLLWVLIFAMISYLIMETGMSFFANSLFIWEYGNAALGALSISVFWCAQTISRFVFAWLPLKKRTMVLLGFSSSVLLLVLLIAARNPQTSLVLYGILGFMMGPVWPMIVGTGAHSFPAQSGAAVGILAASGGLGGIITPPLIGFLSERYGIYSGFASIAVFAAAAFILVFCKVKEKR
ncbi:MAG: MFS transporter [Treponema sp.]|jgi:fucose permease|nr:MFS transporter [Treponema sp.]